MKKLFDYTLIAISCLFIAVSCTKETEVIEKTSPGDPQEQITPVGRTVTINATLSEELTKVTFDPEFNVSNSPTVMKHTWEEGDKLRVTDESNTANSAVLDLVGGEGTPNGSFSGTMSFEASSYIVEAIPVGEFETGNLQTQDSDGDTSHLKFVASATGVTDLSSIVLSETSKIIGFVVKLPAGAAATINMLTIETSTDDFATKSTLAVMITTPGDTDTDGILKVYANVPASWEIPAGTKMFLRFGSTNASHTVYTRYQEFAAAASITPGKFNYLKLNCSNIDRYAGSSDAGTSSAPYLIADKYQMDAIHGLLVDDETLRYFKMVDDINMTGIVWVPLNNEADGSSHYSKYINFDGDGHTLSYISTASTPPAYPSIFGVLNGTVTNLIIDHATITPGANVTGGKSAILAAYIGSGDCTVSPSVSHVTITNSTVGTSSSKGGNYCGALAAQISKAGTTISDITISDCSVATTNYAGGMIAEIGDATTISGTNTVSGTNVYGSLAGGVVGFANALTTMSGCTYTGASVNATARYCGGMLGSTGNYDSVISDCHVENATINAASDRVGGFVGQIQTKVQVKGCTVGTISQRVALASTSSSATVNAGGFVGVCYGTVTKNGSDRNEAYTTITCTNTATDKAVNIGGFVGYLDAATIEYSDADATMTGVTGQQVGGFAGYLTNKVCTVDHCTARAAISSSGNFAAGFIANAAAANHVVTNNTSSGTVSGASTIGGFAGMISQGTWTNNHTSCTVSGNANIGGFAGQINGTAIVSKSSSTGVTTASGNVCGGFAGIASNGADISDCFSTSNLSGATRKRGGIAGYIDTGTATITRCYTTSNISANFELGGLVGFVASGTTFTMSNSAAWNGSITASTRTDANWSSAACVGVAVSTSCTLTDNYRNPDMALTAYWGTAGYGVELVSGFQHPNVSSTDPLTDWNGNAVTSSTMRPYQGKVETGRTLSELASTTLGWSSEVWDFSEDLPKLK